MKSLNLIDVQEFVNTYIVRFHQDKIQSLGKLKLKTLLRRKNPYLFRAKNITLAQDLVQSLLDAHISSSEEELFGQFLEQLALFIAGKTCDGVKSSRVGVDLEFVDNDVYHLVQIKSGPNWGNSTQQKRQEENFRVAVVDVQTQVESHIIIQPILGICYGRTRTSALRGYFKVVGQNFWYLISNNEHLYTDIIEPIGYKARQHTEEFHRQKARIINLLVEEIVSDFCDNGLINWEKIVQFNSGNFDFPKFLNQQPNK
jgi:hypothetical protein